MKKHIQALHELHHTHHMTHKVLSLVAFSIVMVLAVYGFSRVKAEQSAYAKVPNGNIGICYKVGENFNDPRNHVSCKTYKSVCQTNIGALVECDTGKFITE